MITGTLQGWLRFAAGDPSADWLRHLAGLPCHRAVVSHEFISGRNLGYREGMCVWLPNVTADWCPVPRRCHLLTPDREGQDA